MTGLGSGVDGCRPFDTDPDAGKKKQKSGRLVQTLPEFQGGQGQDADAPEQEIEGGVPEFMPAGAFQEETPDDLQIVLEGNEGRDRLDRRRHILHREDEAGQ